MNRLRRLIARYRVARRLNGGRYVLRGSRGQVLVQGRIRGRLFALEFGPGEVLHPGIARRLEVHNGEGKLAIELEQKPFSVSRKRAFGGRRFVFP